MNGVFQKNPLPGPDPIRVGRETLSDELMEEWYEMESEGNFAPRSKNSWRPVWVVFFIFLIIVGFGVGAMYWIIQGKNLPIVSPVPRGRETLEISLEASSSEVDSGDTIRLIVTYVNTGKSHLTDVSATMVYPDNFIFIESAPISPENFDKNYWKIPAIPENGSGKLEIAGQLLGVQGEVKKFEAGLMYKPTNFNSTFKASAAKEFTIQRSVLAVELLGPDNLLPNQDVRYTISILNIAASSLENVRVRLTYPEEFALKEPLSDTVENVWRVLILKPGEKKELVISGKMLGKSGDLKEFKAEAGIEQGGEFVLQNQAVRVASVIEPVIEVQAIVETTGVSSPRFGESLEARIRIANMSTLTLEPVKIEVSVFDPENVIEWDTLVVEPIYQYEVISATTNFFEGNHIVRFTRLPTLLPASEFEIPFTFSFIDVPLDIETDEFYIEFAPRFRAESSGITAPLEVAGETVRVDIVKLGT